MTLLVTVPQITVIIRGGDRLPSALVNSSTKIFRHSLGCHRPWIVSLPSGATAVTKGVLQLEILKKNPN